MNEGSSAAAAGPADRPGSGAPRNEPALRRKLPGCQVGGWAAAVAVRCALSDGSVPAGWCAVRCGAVRIALAPSCHGMPYGGHGTRPRAAGGGRARVAHARLRQRAFAEGVAGEMTGSWWTYLRSERGPDASTRRSQSRLREMLTYGYGAGDA